MTKKERHKKRRDRPGELKRWQLLEVVVHAIELEAGVGASVTYDAKIPELRTGIPRQIDIAIETEQAGRRFLRIVEVQHRSRSITVQNVDSIEGKLIAVGAHRATLVATAGFSGTAIERVKASSHQIDARALVEMGEKGWPDWMDFRSIIVDGEPMPTALTHRRCLDAVTGATVTDVFYGHAKSIGGIVCLMVPPGGRPADLVNWIIGDDPTIAGFEVRLKHHDESTGLDGVAIAGGTVNRWKDGEPIHRLS